MPKPQLRHFRLRIYSLSLPGIRGVARTSLATAVLALLWCAAACAQGGVPLITVATDQSSLDLSNQFGIPIGSAVNQAGDFAFVGSGGAALYFRTAGANSATRLLQIYDEAPGFAGSQITAILPELSLNASRKILFGLRFTATDHFSHTALLAYDASSLKYQTLVMSDQPIVSTGGVYGLDLVPGSIDDAGDVDFEAPSITSTPTGTAISTTLYILPAGATAALRIVGSADPVPIACYWCTSPTNPASFLGGVPIGVGVVVGSSVASFVPPLNARGQVLLSLWGGLFVGAKDGSFTLVPMPNSGPCSPGVPAAQTGLIIGIVNTAFLNNVGSVAFSNPPNSGSAAICVAPADGSAPNAVVSSGASAPAAAGGGTIVSPVALGLNGSGDIIFESPITGSNLTTFALFRYNASSGQIELVAYNCEPAPGVSGAFLALPPSCSAQGSIASLSSISPFSGASISNGGNVSFDASLTNGGSAIYTQTGTATPEFISTEVTGAIMERGGLKISLFIDPLISPGRTEILNNGSVFFASMVTSGSADFAVSLGTPGNVRTLMSTADTLPSGAVALLGSTAPKASGHFVLFTAQPAGGRVNLLESDLTSGTITRVASDNDSRFSSAGGPAGNTLIGGNFFLNGRGQVAFEATSTGVLGGVGAILFGGPASIDTAWLGLPTSCGTLYLWSPSNTLTRVAGSGDAVPSSSAKFSCVALNQTAPSPLNANGDLAFISPAPVGAVLPSPLGGPFAQQGTVNGDFLYSASTGTISEIAAANETLPGQSQATSLVPSLSVPTNSAGQVAFGAELGTNTWGLYDRSGSTVLQVVASGDAVPGSTGAFQFPHFITGLTDTGNLAFTASTSGSNDGLFLAPAGSAIQTIALDGGPAPGGGTFVLAKPQTFGLLSFVQFQNFAAINQESDLAFAAAINGGSADSGYFRVLQNGDSAGTLQAVMSQGQSAPGGGTFDSVAIPRSLLDNSGADFALGPEGSLAFLNPFTESSGSRKEGMFVARPDGAILKVIANDDPLPGGGVATLLLLSPKQAAGETGKFAFLAGIEGAPSRRGIFVTAIAPGTAATTTVLNSLQNPAVAQQALTLTATVSSTAPGTPSGSVAFFSNGISLGSGALNRSGQASVTTSALAAGPDSIVAQYAGDSTFASNNSAPMAIVAAGFAPAPASLSVTAGQSLVIPLTVYAPAGSNLNFMLSCSGLPANSSCAFDTNPVAPSATGTVVKLTLATIAGTSLPPLPGHRSAPARPESGVGILEVALLVAFAATAFAWRRAPRLRLAACGGLALFALAVGVAGCGAVGSSGGSGPGSSGTPPGLTTFTVNGASGGTTISVSVKVTVQQ